MASIFYWVYKYVSSHKISSSLILAGITSLLVYASLQLKFEENIVAIMPKDANVEKVAKAFEGFDMNKRLVFHSHTENENYADTLIEQSHAFISKLQSEAGQYIEEIKIEVADDQILDLYDYYYHNLPFYLEQSDYDQITERITDEGAQSSMKQLYKTLISPVGVVTREMQLKDPLGLTGFPLNRAKELQLDDQLSLYKNHIVTKDKKHLLFFIKLSHSPNETGNNGELIEIIDEILPDHNNENLTIEYFGAAAVAVANANRIKKDIYLTVSLALAGLFLFISMFYRSISVFFLALLPGVFGGLVAVSLLSLFKTNVSIISLAVGSVLLGITIDYALHFFTHSKKEKDIENLFKDLTTPLLMSSVTTASAFYSLIFIRSTALQDLGIFAGTSVIGATLFTLLVLPHFVSSNNKDHSHNWVEEIVDKLAKYSFYNKKWTLISILVISVVSLFTWRNISFESDMLKLNYMPDELAIAEQNINAVSDYSANNIYLTTTGSTIWEALEVSQPLELLLSELTTDSIIFNHLSLSKIIPPLDTQKNRLEMWNQFWDENDANEVLNRLNENALNFGFKPNSFTSLDSLLHHSYSDISNPDMDQLMSILGEDLIINNEDGSISALTIIKLSNKNKSHVLDRLSNMSNITILDRGYLTKTLITLLNEDFNKLVNISLVVVFLIILVCYGRIELTLITFIPIALSWLWVLGLMGLFGLKFNIINIIVCTFILGLGIDYSIFVMRGLTQRYKYGVENLTSYKRSIILSMVSTLLGIGVLAFAEHPALKSIALLAIIGIVSVIFITFTIEHLLFNLFIGNRKKKGVIPFTITSLLLTIIAFSYFVFGCLILQILRPFFMIPIGSLKVRKRVYHRFIRLFSGTIIGMMANFGKKVVDINNIDYSKPSVIISNHHSFIDILILLMFSPKVVMVTNDWVYNSPFFGKPVQFADFIAASKGLETQLDKIQQIINDGYSIIVYPEGTRTGAFELKRFHKGAFYLADYFKLDIQPIILHGTSMVMPKGDDFYLKNNMTTIKFLPRIKYDDVSYGQGYSERTKKISKHFKSEHQKIRKEVETPKYFKQVIVNNYLYKNPILEWYVKIKLRVENHYQLFHELVPVKAKVVDLGCGYGIMSQALAFSSSDREVYGYDYDHNKIEVAKNCPALPPNVRFAQADVATTELEHADVFLICDVLHYLTFEEQSQVLNNMMKSLNPSGIIIIRDGDSDKADRHKGTKLTEFFSINFGFNKTRNNVNYISGNFIKQFCEDNEMNLEVIDNTKRTSNTVFVLKRK